MTEAIKRMREAKACGNHEPSATGFNDWAAVDFCDDCDACAAIVARAAIPEEPTEAMVEAAYRTWSTPEAHIRAALTALREEVGK